MSDRLIDAMRPVAAHLPSVVGARDGKGTAALLAKAPDVPSLQALVLLLAESASPSRLAAVTGYLVPLPPREAHAVYARLRRDGLPVPAHVREGERAYQAASQRAPRKATRQRREGAAA